MFGSAGCAVLGAALGAGLLTAALAMAVSLRVPVARSAQQVCSLLVMVVGMVAESLLGRAPGLDPAALFRADLLLAALGCVALSLAMGLFRRDRFFDAP